MSDTHAEDSKSPLRASFDDSRSLLKWLLLLALGIVGFFFYFTHSPNKKPVSEALSQPKLESPAGGGNHTKKLDQLAIQQDKQAAVDAEKSGRSYTAALAGKDIQEPVANELGYTPMETHDTVPVPTTAHNPSQSVTPVSQSLPTDNPKPSPVPDPFSDQVDQTPPRHQKNKTSDHADAHLSEHAEIELIEAWTGRKATLERVSPTRIASTDQADNDRRTMSTQDSRQQAGTGASDMSTTKDKRGTLLLAAGRGVYGHSVLTSNSDLGKEVLVEIDTGPFRKARISGTFSMQSDRLIIKFNKLMIGNNDPLTVSAYAVSPETAETGVASEVKEHLATRIILPAAAAFVQGLGNAMMSANTSSYTGGYGMTSFTHLNIAQQMGAAAGTMGQVVGQLLQKQTPQQATVKLNKGDTVGVLFDTPVYAP